MSNDEQERKSPVSRTLTRVLILTLMPVLLVAANGRSAQAVTRYGAAASASFEVGPYGFMSSCSLTGFLAVSETATSVEIRSASCSTSPIVSSLGLSLSARGDNCSFAGNVGEMDGGASLSASLAASGYNNPVGCVVTELCFETVTSSHTNPWSDDVETGCVPFPLGAPPELPPSGQCAYGTPALPSTITPTQNGTANYWRNTVNIAGSEGPFINTAPAWHLYAIIREPGYGPGGYGIVRAVTVATSITVGPLSVFHDVPWFNGTRKDAPIIGWGLAHNTEYNKNRGPKVLLLPQNDPTGVQGINNPGDCLWYFGPKIAEIANSDIDEPGGAMGTSPGSGSPTEPVDEPPPPKVASGCEGFSFSDPATWAGAGICVLVKAVMGLWDTTKKVLAALGSLPARMWDVISAGLQALLIPEASSWGFDGLYDQFEARPPGSVLVSIGDGMTGFIGGYSAGGCGVLADFSSEDMDAQLTCSNVKSIPGYGALYALVQVGMFALTGLAVFRMLAGKVGGDDG